MGLTWLILPLVVALWMISMKAFREHVSRNLSRLGARQLSPCGFVMKTFGSWSKGAGATAFLTGESLFLRTGHGGFQVDRKGTHTKRIGHPVLATRVYADEVSAENDQLKILFSGFISGSLTLSGLPGNEREKIMAALKGLGTPQ